jgi:hypothetical protein
MTVVGIIAGLFVIALAALLTDLLCKSRRYYNRFRRKIE